MFKLRGHQVVYNVIFERSEAAVVENGRRVHGVTGTDPTGDESRAEGVADVTSFPQGQSQLPTCK